jgi:hypothetical protein
LSAILFNRTFLARLAESENRHVVNARFETVCVAQMRAQRSYSRIIQVLNMPTGQANQVMVGWCGQQFVNGPGLAQIDLGDERQVFEPLKHTVNGGFRHRNALGFKILLDALGRLMPSEFTQVWGSFKTSARNFPLTQPIGSHDASHSELAHRRPRDARIWANQRHQMGWGFVDRCPDAVVLD